MLFFPRSCWSNTTCLQSATLTPLPKRAIGSGVLVEWMFIRFVYTIDSINLNFEFVISCFASLEWMVSLAVTHWSDWLTDWLLLDFNATSKPWVIMFCELFVFSLFLLEYSPLTQSDTRLVLPAQRRHRYACCCCCDYQTTRLSYYVISYELLLVALLPRFVYYFISYVLRVSFLLCFLRQRFRILFGCKNIKY